MKRFLVFVGLILFILGASYAQGGFNPDRLATYEKYLQKEIDEGKVPGCVSMIYRKGELAHFKAMGYNNVVGKDPMNTNQLFYIQSMTKPIISVAFMMLYEEGHFFLGDKVSDYLPGFDSLMVAIDYGNPDSYELMNKPIEMWHLLSHSAGFSHGLGQSDYDKDLNKKLYETEHADIEDRVKALLSHPLMGHPGEQWNYSAAPDVLALLIEYFSGQSPAEFLQERLFDPLGMTNTGYNISPEKEERQAALHSVMPSGKVMPVPDYNPKIQGNTVFGGTHGLFSTAEDYMKFAKMLLNGGTVDGKQYLSPKTIELMTENFVGDMYGAGNGFGLGFGMRTDLSDSEAVGSVGTYYWSGAFNTYFIIDPEEEMVAILMTQFWPYTNFYANKMRQLVYSAIQE